MIFLNFGKWSNAAGSFLILERYYYKGYWTPFCKIRLRYFKTMRQMMKKMKSKG